MRGAPENAAISSILEHKETRPITPLRIADYIYEVKDRPDSQRYGPSYIEDQSDGIVSGSHGCVHGSDPNLPDACASEEDLVAKVMETYRNGRLDCSHSAPELISDRLPPYAGVAGNNSSSSEPYGKIDYGAKQYRTVRNCSGVQSSFIFKIFKVETFLCASGYSRLSDQTPGDGSGDITLPALCKYNGGTRTINGPIQQFASCKASKYPCYPATGDKARDEPDFTFAGRTFTRHYHSFHQFRNNSGAGVGWTHTFGDRIFGIPNASPAALVDETGTYESFIKLANGQYRGENSTDKLLESYSSGTVRWRLRLPGGEIREFNSSGQLVKIANPSDPRFDATLSYGNGLLSKVTDGQGRVLAFDYSSEKMLAQITLPDGRYVRYSYDVDRNLTTVLYSDNGSKQYHYAEAGLIGDPSQRNHLTGITAETGERFASFKYDGLGRVIESRAFGTPNDVTTVSYDSDTQATVSLASGKIRTYTIQPGFYRRVTAIKNAGELVEAKQGFDAEGRLTSSTDRRNVVTGYEYDASNTYRSAVIEAVGSLQERREEVTRVPGTNLVTERRTRDSFGVLKAKTNWTYNGRNQVIGVTATDPVDNATRTASMTYCEQADVDNGVCPQMGLITKVDGPRAGPVDETTYIYRAADEPTCTASPQTCPYRKGDLWKVVNPLGHVVELLSSDGAGRPLSMRDANGVVTDMEYSPRGWLVTTKVRGSDDTVETDDQITRIAYKPTGVVEQVVQPDGNIVTFGYDPAQRLTSITDGAGNRVSYTLNAAGERVADTTVDSTGAVVRSLSRIYDTLGRLHAQRDALDRATVFGYDDEDNLTLTTDALSRKTASTYDALGRLKTSVQDSEGIAASTGFEYDTLDRLTQVTDPNGLPTVYGYNGFGDLLTQESPDTGTSTSTYDEAGQLKTRTDARGVVATYGYDLLGRLVSVSYPDASRNVGYVYDTAQSGCLAGENAQIGRLSQMTDASGSTSYCYDRFGHRTRKLQITQQHSYPLTYDYTPPSGYNGNGVLLRPRPPAGHLMALMHPDGTRVRFDRNQLRQATTLTVTLANGQVKHLLRGASYHPFGPVARWEYGNGRVLRRSLNMDYQPGFVEDETAGGISEGYWFDAVGNLESLRYATQAEPPRRTYVYDGLNRLKQVKDGASNAVLQAYDYDATGNRISATDAGVGTAFTYATDSHHLLSVGGETRGYDAVGNTLRIERSAASGGGDDGSDPYPGGGDPGPGDPGPGDPGPGDPGSGSTQSIGAATADAMTATVAALREFTYDASNRMRQVKVNGAVAMTYLYNAIGERVYKSGGGTGVTTLHDESGHWIGDYDVNGQPIQQAIWMDDLPVGLLVGAGANQKLYYIEADALGTPRVVIDPDRNVAVWRWDLAGEAFGNNTPNEDPDGDGTAFVFDMRFPGQRYDSATGMNYNYFRDYDPSVGRYTQSDPIGLAGGISTYGYVGGNPLTRTDAFGLRPGDCYKSPQIAAANAISDINPTSIKENKEYAGWVYKTSNGWYSYTTPRVGTNRLSSAGPRPTGAIGGYHTHGAWDPAFVMNGVDGNEVFSYSPYGNDLNIPVGDWAFLGTPRGRLWQYRNSGRGNAPKPMDPASPNNADACGCQGRNNYDDLSQVWWRFLTGE